MGFYMMLAALAELIATTATTGCFFFMLDEVEMPNSLIEK